ncbi:major facilitator superfamily-domain-containing protein [Gilbertella persicaria]|uniref:major facilitator superfamily-domain-containing protein n=1 Tax=Gilbertella persicaria TaxID=101096 RepID=UPI002220228D|nr:major facilitator superfamily-domain-containing protein [Gilbertella persicaria]KAI8067674.1 major facilitator superfamily-domain-containing protein [Gilbertella persicaria]
MNDKIDSTLPKGVRIAYASNFVATKYDKIFIFIGLALVSWIMSWEKNIVNTITPTVTSEFNANGLTGVLTTVLGVMQTALQPMYSKFADMTGRTITYTVSLLFFMVSFIAMACATDYNALIGGQVIYALGYSGLYILGPILIGDSISLVNRTLVLAFYNFPLIINLFAGGAAAQRMLETAGWRWAFGHISIVIFVASIPIMIVLWSIQRKAKRAGLIKYESADNQIDGPKNFTYFFRKLVWVCNEIDLIGSIFLLAGFFLILLPLILANTWGGWQSPVVIGCLVGGGVTWCIFAFWESKIAPKPIFPMKKWDTYNPLYGTAIVFLIWAINGMMDLQYFLTYLKVTRRVKSDIATYLERGFNASNVVLAVPIGYAVKRTRRWRPFVWIGSCFAVLGSGLLIPARSSHSPDVFIVMSQIILGTGCAFMNYPTSVGIQGSVPREDVAIVIAFFEVGVAIASSIGSTIAGAIWNSVLPGLFEKYVPGEYDYAKITGSIPVALALPEEQYKGVVKAYDAAMHILSIVAVCMGGLAFLLATQLKGYALDQNKQEQEETLDQNETIFVQNIMNEKQLEQEQAYDNNKHDSHKNV